MMGEDKPPAQHSDHPHQRQDDAANTASVRPTEPQKRYLERGLCEPGGKLPLFDRNGREVPKKTIEACVAHGWATAWTANPINPEWLVCRLTSEGYRVAGGLPPKALESQGKPDESDG